MIILGSKDQLVHVRSRQPDKNRKRIIEVPDHNRRTQLLLPPTVKVAKSDFEPQIGNQLAND